MKYYWQTRINTDPACAAREAALLDGVQLKELRKFDRRQIERNDIYEDNHIAGGHGVAEFHSWDYDETVRPVTWLETLTEQEKLILRLHIEGYTLREIAKQLGCCKSVVERKLNRAKDKARKEVEEFGVEI